MHLILEYVRNITDEVAQRELEKLKARGGIDKVCFAWAGSNEPKQPHYYRIHGPSFLVEYDNVQNGANHIHSVWRDVEGDFGVDLLAQHYQEHHQ